MVIASFYEGKSILITGTTGFVGKVIVEKILRDLPQIRHIYLIIRTSNNQPVRDRFEEEILNTKAFDLIRAAHPNDFESYVYSKVIPVLGDLSKSNLGLSDSDIAMLVDDVNVVVHCAASIDFKDRLDRSVEANVLGTMRLFNLSKTFRNLLAFVHCSTAYVNSNIRGKITEELPLLDFDPEQAVQTILNTDPAKLEKMTPAFVGKYPNTYTYTKAITERILAAKRGTVPVVILRPTIIGSSSTEPFAGWVDSVVAIAAVMLYTGVGLVQFLKGQPELVADIVPVDLVVNAILAAPLAVAGQNRLEIFHVGTSHRNPVRWGPIGHWVTSYWRSHLPVSGIAPPAMLLHKTTLGYKTHFFFKFSAPSFFFGIYAQLFGGESQKRQSARFNKALRAARLIADTFEYFTSNEWCFLVDNLERLYFGILDAEDRRVFGCDARDINWRTYFFNFCYGLQKNILKEEGIRQPLEILNDDVITRDQIRHTGYFSWMFSDITWAFRSYRNVTPLPVQARRPKEIKSLVLNTNTVRAAMDRVAQEEGVSVSVIERRAGHMIDRMGQNLTIPVARVVGWFLKKVFRRIYQGIHVDEKGLQACREAVKRSPLVLVPTHRSYVDFLIISYIFFEYDLPLPQIAAGEDFLGIIIVRWIFRNCGAFFLRRSFHGDSLYWAVFSEYVQRMVVDHRPMEFFIEGKRSRSGKSLYPKMGLLGIVTEPFLTSQVQDVSIAPISISYEKVLEGELYSNEMMGESKTKESLEGLFRASKILRMNWGRIHVVIVPPISVRKYTEEFINNSTQQRMLMGGRPKVTEPSHVSDPSNPGLVLQNEINAELKAPLEVPESLTPPAPIFSSPFPPPSPTPLCNPYTDRDDKRQLIQSLAYKIVDDLNQHLIITTTAIVSTVLLTYRRGINREELISKVDWLREEIISHGALVAFDGPTSNMVDYALKLLSNLVSKRRNMFEPTNSLHGGGQGQGNPNHNYRRNILVLSFYRNQLLHQFQWEGIFACVLAWFSGYGGKRKKSEKSEHQSNDKTLGVDEHRLFEEVSFIAQLLSVEFVNPPNTLNGALLNSTLNKLVDRGFVHRHETEHADTNTRTAYYRISSRGEGPISFLCHMFWPFIESAMVSCVTLFSIQPDLEIKTSLLQQRMGWLAEKMYDEGKLYFYESCSMELLCNSTQTFMQMGVLKIKRPEPPKPANAKNAGARKKQNNAQNSSKVTDTEMVQLLPPYTEKDGPLKALAERISRYRRSPPIISQQKEYKRVIVEEFPLLAKL